MLTREERWGQPRGADARLGPEPAVVRRGLTVVRISADFILGVHGFQKFTGRIAGGSGYFEKLGIPSPGLIAPIR